MKRVVVDLDGCCSEFNAPMWQLLNQYCPMTPLPDTGPDVWDWYRKYGASDKAIDLAHQDTTPRWWGDLPPHADFTKKCRELLEDLHDEAEVSFVTARPRGRDETVKWLRRYLPLVPHPQVVLTPTNKAAALFAMEPHIIVEDSGMNLAAYQQLLSQTQRNRVTLILVNRPYNSHYRGRFDLDATTTLDAMSAAMRLCERN